MKQFNQMMLSLYFAVMNGWNEFKASDRGDTNFVSILIILGMVVVLASLFWAVAKPAMEQMTQKFTDFIATITT